MRYEHIFFDLDHTLWDFKTNSRNALSELFELHLKPRNPKISFNRFYDTYQSVNDRWWAQYRAEKVDKESLRTGRFRDSLHRFGIVDESLTESLSQGYVDRSPYLTSLFPNALDVLRHLMDKGYRMHIITNGFEEVQHIKIRESGLRGFFEEIITSEQAGVKKPDPGIFEYALERTSASLDRSMMIGDNLHADIQGAKEIGMDQVWFDPHSKGQDGHATHRIHDLRELKSIL